MTQHAIKELPTHEQFWDTVDSFKYSLSSFPEIPNCKQESSSFVSLTDHCTLLNLSVISIFPCKTIHTHSCCPFHFRSFQVLFGSSWEQTFEVQNLFLFGQNAQRGSKLCSRTGTEPVPFWSATVVLLSKALAAAICGTTENCGCTEQLPIWIYGTLSMWRRVMLDKSMELCQFSLKVKVHPPFPCITSVTLMKDSSSWFPSNWNRLCVGMGWQVMLLKESRRRGVSLCNCWDLFSANKHVCWDGNKFSGFREWQHSLYHPSLRVTQAYDVSVTLSMPSAVEQVLHYGSSSPSLVLPVYDDFLLRRPTYFNSRVAGYSYCQVLQDFIVPDFWLTWYWHSDLYIFVWINVCFAALSHLSI